MDSDTSVTSDDPATQYVQNLTAREALQNLGEDPSAYGQLFEDVANVEPVDPTIPRIGDPMPPRIAAPPRPPRSSGVGTTPNRQPPANDLVQRAIDQSELNLTPPITSGTGSNDQQRPPRRTATSTRTRVPPRRTATSTRRRRRAQTSRTTTTRSQQAPAGSARTRQRTRPANVNQGRMQQPLRLLLDDIAADQREISNIVTTNTVTTTYKQNRRRPTVTNTRTAVGNNPRNRPTVRRTSTRVTQ